LFASLSKENKETVSVYVYKYLYRQLLSRMELKWSSIRLLYCSNCWAHRD